MLCHLQTMDRTGPGSWTWRRLEPTFEEQPVHGRREKNKRQMQEKKEKQAPPAVPTRRIGNLFSHNSSQWRMEPDEEDEPFPAPPSQEEVNNNQLFEEQSWSNN